SGEFVIACAQRFTYVAARLIVGAAARHCRGPVPGRRRRAPPARPTRLSQLRLPYRLVEVDILRGERRTPEFLAKNPSGQVPLLEVAPGRHIAESNSILWYVA